MPIFFCNIWIILCFASNIRACLASWQGPAEGCLVTWKENSSWYLFIYSNLSGAFDDYGGWTFFSECCRTGSGFQIFVHLSLQRGVCQHRLSCAREALGHCPVRTGKEGGQLDVVMIWLWVKERGKVGRKVWGRCSPLQHGLGEPKGQCCPSERPHIPQE